MVSMHDTEGAALPPDNDGKASFDLALMGGTCGRETWVGLSIPMHFVVPYDDEDRTYSSGGVLSVDLRDVLEEYVSLDHLIEDGGESLVIVEALFREYADKIASARRNLTPIAG